MSLNGVEKTFTEPNLAGMLNLRKGPLYEMLGQATQQQLAQPRTNTTPPIWQGRAAHGENAAILGRNPDGTFQVSLNGVEKSFKEPQVAAMTRLKKAPSTRCWVRRRGGGWRDFNGVCQWLLSRFV